MSATAILSAFLLFSLVLMVESCMKMHEGVHTTHGFPVSDDVTAKQGKNGKNSGRNSGPVPAHPFRRRSVQDDEEVEEPASDMPASDIPDFVTAKLQELFKDLDSDEDHLVTETEWTRRKASVTQFQRILSKFDKDGDQSLTFEEFLAATTNSWDDK